MATNLQDFNKVFVYINGSLLYMAQSVSVQRISGASQVHTIAGGFVGMQPGSPMCNISVESATPAAGFEFDASDYIGSLDPVEMTVEASGMTLTLDVVIPEDDISYSTDGSAKLSFKGVGVYAPWQSI